MRARRGGVVMAGLGGHMACCCGGGGWLAKGGQAKPSEGQVEPSEQASLDAWRLGTTSNAIFGVDREEMVSQNLIIKNFVLFQRHR